MFGEVLAEYVEWTPAALDDEIARLELASRALDARRLAARAAAESVRLRRSMGTGRPRRICGRRAISRRPWRSAEVRRARICRDFPDDR